MDFYFENNMKSAGLYPCCGIDEAGRGPLAGPVCAAAVILPENCMIEGLDDSKKLSEKKRELLFPVIKEKAIAFGIAFATVEEIDNLNILNATFLAMKRAVDSLEITPQSALVDGNRDPKLSIPTLTVIKGDSKSPSIAAASILAKVTRDKYMLELDENYPQYDFKKHKGYGTKEHYEMLFKYGISEVHRVTFLKNLEEKKAKYEKEQQRSKG